MTLEELGHLVVADKLTPTSLLRSFPDRRPGLIVETHGLRNLETSESSLPPARPARLRVGSARWQCLLKQLGHELFLSQSGAMPHRSGPASAQCAGAAECLFVRSGSIGWNSPNRRRPDAAARLPARSCTARPRWRARQRGPNWCGRWRPWCDGYRCGRSTRSTQAIFARDLFLKLRSALASLSSSARALRTQHRLPGVEEHFRLEHKAVTHDAHVGRLPRMVRSRREEVRGDSARARCHPLRQRDISRWPRSAMRACKSLSCSRLPPAPTRSPRAGAAAPRSAVEYLDLRQRTGGEPPFGFELARQLGGLPCAYGRPAPTPS